MPPPQASYVTRSADKGYDPATLSDDEDDDTAAVTSRSTWTSAAEGETTILGLTDGRIPAAKADDLSDWKISRVGGLPSFPLAKAPTASAAHCLSCSRPMPLLAQVYCPLPTSSLERVLYTFACPRPACRRKEGAIRAWRANGLWVVEGAAEQARKAEEDEHRAREEQERVEARKRAQAIDLGGLIFGGSSGAGAGLPAATGASNPFATPTPAATGSTNPFALPAPASSKPPVASSSNPFAPAPSTSTVPSNPFAPAPSTSTVPSNPFALPATPNPFAAPALSRDPPPTAAAPAAEEEPVTSSWHSTPDAPIPAYPAHYISTMYEPPAGAAASKGKGKGREADLAALAGGMSLAEDGGNDDGDDDEDERVRPGKGAGGRTKKGAPGGVGRKDGTGGTKTAAGGGGGWEGEGYEVQKVKGVDEVFLRFQERVQREGRQVVRYEFGAQPVPYTASSAAYRLAYPSPSSSHPVSSAASAQGGSAAPSVGAYAASRLPPCRSCGGPTTFEAQVMPHLVALLNATDVSGGGEGEAQDWATVWVLSCEGECVGGAKGEGESWREERVLAEWEEEAV